MTIATAPGYFDNYTKVKPAIPASVWWIARGLGLVITFTLAGLLMVAPAIGLRVFWGLAIPVLPIVLVFMPGLWRQVCPMAFFNQLPRTFGFGGQAALPEVLRNWAFAIAMAGFIAFVVLRAPLLNTAPLVDGIGILAALGLAFLGGLAFKGRSGWCGTFCALGPIQRVYGQAPVVMVRNGYCPTCVGCQKSCYDFNPRAAVFSDVFDEDPRYSSQRRLFMGLLPGLILGYFGQDMVPAYGEILRIVILFACCAASAGLYGLAIAFLPVNPFRIAVVFSAIALAAFYWWSGPNLVGTIVWLFGGVSPDWLQMSARGIGIVGGLVLVAMGLISERRYTAARAIPARSADATAVLATRLRKAGGRDVTDRSSGVTFEVAQGASLLDAIQSAGLKINYGCRAGVCGADAVAICEGDTNLSPPGDDELATLRRLGLEGKARLACVCKVSGPVVIDRDPHSPAGPATAKPKAVVLADKAKAQGVSRVVIVGNGIAGMSVAEAIRRDSSSVAITMVTNEPIHFYNRMAIGRVIYDGSGMDGLQLVPDAWFMNNSVDVMRNTVANGIDRTGKRLRLATGDALPYDKLFLATGARAASPTLDFLNYSNAFVLRSIDDARHLRTYIQQVGARRAVVIGGGVLGVEAADALRHLGLNVAILQRADRLMNAQLDETAAARLTSYLSGIGVQTVCNSSIDRFEGDDTIKRAYLSHGPRVRADIFVACLGIEANTFLAKQAGLETGRGIKVDDAMRTTDPDIYAVGDVAEFAGLPGGLWPTATAHAGRAVANMIGEETSSASPGIVLRLKCDGVDLYSYGSLQPKPGDEKFSADPTEETWWRVIARQGQIVGAVYFGLPGSGRKFHEALQKPETRDALYRSITRGEPDFLPH